MRQLNYQFKNHHRSLIIYQDYRKKVQTRIQLQTPAPHKLQIDREKKGMRKKLKMIYLDHSQNTSYIGIPNPKILQEFSPSNPKDAKVLEILHLEGNHPPNLQQDPVLRQVPAILQDHHQERIIIHLAEWETNRLRSHLWEVSLLANYHQEVRLPKNHQQAVHRPKNQQNLVSRQINHQRDQGKSQPVNHPQQVSLLLNLQQEDKVRKVELEVNLERLQVNRGS